MSKILFVGGPLDGEWRHDNGREIVECSQVPPFGERLSSPGGLTGPEDRAFRKAQYHRRPLAGGDVMAVASLSVDEVITKLVQSYRPGPIVDARWLGMSHFEVHPEDLKPLLCDARMRPGSKFRIITQNPHE